MTAAGWARVNGGGRSCTLALGGRFDFNFHAGFRRASEEALSWPGSSEIVIDLQAATFLDSSALGMLLNLRDSAGKRGKPVVLSNARGMVRQILGIARFAAIFEMR